MKYVILFSITFLYFSHLTLAQTREIARKSQAGTSCNKDYSPDNFGLHPFQDKLQVDSVKFFRTEKMYVEYSQIGNDTAWFKQETDSVYLNSIKYIGLYYPSTTIFIDYPTELKNDNSLKQSDVQKNQFSYVIMAIFLLVGLGILIKSQKTAHV